MSGSGPVFFSFAGYQFKVFIETGKIIKSALITELLDAEVVLDQWFSIISLRSQLNSLD
jgi:hypothetical protein